MFCIYVTQQVVQNQCRFNYMSDDFNLKFKSSQTVIGKRYCDTYITFFLSLICVVSTLQS